MSLDRCLGALSRLSKSEALEILGRLDQVRERLRAEGRMHGIDQRLREVGRDLADRVQRRRILERRHAQLTIIVRDRVEGAIDSMVTQGLTPEQAVMAILEGTTKNLRGARDSAAAVMMAYENRYLAPLMAAVARERPHLERLLTEPIMPSAGRRSARQALMEDVARELHQPRGADRATANADAHFLADRMAALLETSRQDLNRVGADIGRLDGYLPHSHDNERVMRVDRDEWVRRIMPLLDRERTFGAAADDDEITEILREIYLNIVSGRHDAPTSAQRGEFTGPRNLARAQERHRIQAGRNRWDITQPSRFCGESAAIRRTPDSNRRPSLVSGRVQAPSNR